MDEFFNYDYEITEGFVQETDELTLNTLRSLAKTTYAPELEYYDSSLNHGIMETWSPYLYRIPKPNSIDPDEIHIEIISSALGLLEFELKLELAPSNDHEDIITDLSTIINIGKEKLESSLFIAFESTFKNSLINDRFLIILQNVNVSSDREVLIISYHCKAIDEQGLQPKGKYYEETKSQSKIGK